MTTTTSAPHFRFGQNWRDYALNVMDADRLAQARAALAALLGTQRLDGLTVLDIGCGSGLHTTAALQLGAAHVTAVDIDPDCIAVTRHTLARFLPAATNVAVRQADILADAALPTADVVYSWGVLHHTGHMTTAIRRAAALVAPGGLFVIAIYNRHSTSAAWRVIKAAYNRAPQPVRRALYALFYGVIFVAKALVTRRNPLRKERGMDFGYDVVDWIGGYPYEYASVDEVRALVEPLGFTTERMVPAEVGTGCNEFVFRRIRVAEG